MLKSDYRSLGAVALPIPRGRQMYMQTVHLDAPAMRPGFEDYLEPVVELCRRAGAKGAVHVTVDEKVLSPGDTQRRPGPHVDGRFDPVAAHWGHKGDGWRHYCNDIGRGTPGRMAVIVASTEPGCRAWKGEFDAEPASDGDLGHLELGDGELLTSHTGYLLSPDCVHESVPMTETVHRGFLRIALEEA